MVGVSADGTKTWFLVDDAGIFKRFVPDSSVPLIPTLLEKIRVLAFIKGKWRLDPPPRLVYDQDKAWIYNNKPLVGLQWDLGEFVCKGMFTEQSKVGTEFFTYSVKLGRTIIAETEQCKPAVEFHWTEYGIYKELRCQLLKDMWKNTQSPKITVFRWFLIHRGLAVGETAKGIVSSIMCPQCTQ